MRSGGSLAAEEEAVRMTAVRVQVFFFRDHDAPPLNKTRGMMLPMSQSMTMATKMVITMRGA